MADAGGFREVVRDARTGAGYSTWFFGRWKTGVRWKGKPWPISRKSFTGYLNAPPELSDAKPDSRSDRNPTKIRDRAPAGCQSRA